MLTLKLVLSAVDAVNFFIIANENAQERSSLPFADEYQDPRLFTFLYALNTLDAQYKQENDDEKKWMMHKGFLSEDGKSFDSKMREKLGKILYDHIFPGKIRDTLNKKLGERGDKELHIQIQFDSDVLEKSNLPLYPWNLAHNGEDFLVNQGIHFSYLIIHQDFGPEWKAKEKYVEQVKILLISSQASGEHLGKLQSQETTVRAVMEKARKGSRISLLSWHDERETPTYRRLYNYLNHQNNLPFELPDIIHFNGHGQYKRQCNNPSCRCYGQCYPVDDQKCHCCKTDLPQPQGFLLFEGENGSVEYISAKKFTELMQNVRLKPSLVIITACLSASAHESDCVFSGIAQSLTRIVPAVIATPFQISQESTTKFIDSLYSQLSSESSLLKSVAYACKNMYFKDYEWYRLVTFLSNRKSVDEERYTNSNVPFFVFANQHDSEQEKCISRQEKPALIIANRQSELGQFREMLSGNLAENIFKVTGKRGSGKSILFKKFKEECENRGIDIIDEVLSNTQLGLSAFLERIAKNKVFRDADLCNFRECIDRKRHKKIYEFTETEEIELLYNFFADIDVIGTPLVFMFYYAEYCRFRETLINNFVRTEIAIREKVFAVLFSEIEIPMILMEDRCIHIDLDIRKITEEEWYRYAQELNLPLDRSEVFKIARQFKEPWKIDGELRKYCN